MIEGGIDETASAKCGQQIRRFELAKLIATERRDDDSSHPELSHCILINFRGPLHPRRAPQVARAAADARTLGTLRIISRAL